MSEQVTTPPINTGGDNSGQKVNIGNITGNDGNQSVKLPDNLQFKTKQQQSSTGVTTNPVNTGEVKVDATKTTQQVETKVEETKVENNIQQETKVDETANDNQQQNDLQNLSDVEYTLHQVTSELGLDLTDKEKTLFNDILNKNFSEDVSALTSLVKNLARVGGSRMVNEYYNSLPENVKRFADFVSKGGDEHSYFAVQKLNYEKIKITKENTAIHKDMLMEGYIKLHNMSLEDANKFATVIVDKGEGYTEALAMQNKLVQYKKQEVSKIEAQTHQMYLQQIQEANQRKQQVANKINSGKLQIGDETLIIPEADRQILYAAITEPYFDTTNNCYYDRSLKPIAPNKVKNINNLISKADAAKLQYGVDGELLNTYFALFGGLDRLVKQKVMQENVNRLRNFSDTRVNATNKLSNKVIETTNTSKPKLRLDDIIGK